MVMLYAGCVRWLEYPRNWIVYSDYRTISELIIIIIIIIIRHKLYNALCRLQNVSTDSKQTDIQLYLEIDEYREM